MTTSVGNNSVFRSFFEKQKLTGPNFIYLYIQLRLVLSIEDKENYLERPISASPVALPRQQVPPEALAAHAAWVKGQKEELKALYIKQVEQELLQIVSSYVLKMKSYIDNLERLGQLVSQNLVVSLILVSLNKDYDSFVYNYNTHGIGKTVNELHAMLKLHEDTLPKEYANHALHAIRAGRVQKNQKINRTKLLRRVMVKAKARWAMHLTMCHLLPNLRLLHHLRKITLQRMPFATNGLRISKKLKPGALSLYVGDGHRAAVEAIRTYHLDLPNVLVIILNNCHYAPSITRGAISVSCLFDDGFINRFDDNNVISGSKNNLVYFMDVPQDGYPKETMGYSFYNQSKNKVFVARNAEFFKNDLIDLKASGSVEDLELIQEEDTNPSLDTSLDHEKDDQEIDEPQSDINPIRRFIRTRRPTDRLCLYIDAEEHELGDLDEPANYKAALLDLESKKWLDAMNVEMQSMKDNDVWVLFELSPNARTFGSKWLFKKKTDMDGAVYVFKSRLVAKGFTQTYGVDYEETFSHVADIRAIRILIAIVAYYDYKIWQMDVKIAFLNGHLFEEVYMEQPEGFVNPKYPNHVCKLKRSIYRLKQASRQWNKRFDDEI
nr:retrotransposon protein, putative, Ty1-copia subclass [Tanacetum cinerariifolium]